MKGLLTITAIVVFVCGSVLWCLDQTNTPPDSQNEFKVTVVTYEKTVIGNNKGGRVLIRKPKLIIKKISRHPTMSSGFI